MDVRLAPTHIYTLNPALDFEAAKQQAIDKRITTVAGGLGGLFSRPKPEEVDLVHAETRYEPFWHIACTVRYLFERNKEFAVPVTGVEVRSVTIMEREFEIAAQPAQSAPGGGFLSQLGQQIGLGNTVRTFTLAGVEHCLDENRQAHYLDAVNSQAVLLGADYVQKDKTEVTDLAQLPTGEVLVVAPPLSAAKIAKLVLASMIKPIQADKILEETTEIETLDLYFRPIYAFEFAWKTKNKTGVAEFDAVTGVMTSGKALHTTGAKDLTRESLFDINAETVTSLIPTAAGNVQLVP